MSNGKTPLMLMMALAMPGASYALGLGDIHVDSALNERLAAEIDIVGASAAELSDLRAAVANRETFLRYGADRPAFLSTAVFKVTQDSQGRPVLSVRSSDAFTEPMVNFLVDLRWHNSELVRQYTLLLDPPGFGEASRLAAAQAIAATARPSESASLPAPPLAPEVPAAPPSASPRVETQAQTVDQQINPAGERTEPVSSERAARKTTQLKVGAKATLRGIAWRVGERSESDLQKMMLAIFRANPSAFDGNINRLYLGAMLTIPAHEEVETISKAEAKREIHAQMSAWRHASPRPVPAPVPAVSVAGQVAAPSAAPAAAAVPAPEMIAATPVAPAAGEPAGEPATHVAADDKLGNRVQSLEHELLEVKGLLESQNDKLVVMRKQVAEADHAAQAKHVARQEDSVPSEDTVAVAEPLAVVDSVKPQTRSNFIPVLGGIGLLAGALAGIYAGLRRRASQWKQTSAAAGAATDIPIDEDTVVGIQGITPKAVAEQTRADALADTYTNIQTAPFPALATSEEDVTHTMMSRIFDEDTRPLLPVIAPDSSAKGVNTSAATLSAPQGEDTTVLARGDTVNHVRPSGQPVDVTRVDTTRLDYNLTDLDMTARHVHVQMPSALNEQVVMKERRTNLADVLKLAIEREPERHDLRMKLLELYYAAASTNRNAFVEVVQKFAENRDHVPSDQWDKIAYMGRQIAAENPLFAREPDAEDELADCA
jgi:pilus assembly protein FimV